MDWLPKVLPVALPMLNDPVTAEISDCAVEALAVVTSIFLMVLP